MADQTHPDAVDRIAEQWARERPDLDVAPMLVIGRLHRVAELLDQGLRRGVRRGRARQRRLRRAGVTPPLGRAVPAEPDELAATTMVTSGAVTKRVDRLERPGPGRAHGRAPTTPAAA